jgi:hypothetical protein
MVAVRMSDENRRATAKSSSKASNGPVFTVPQLQAFTEEHPLLSVAFVVAAGYAIGRVVSKL